VSLRAPLLAALALACGCDAFGDVERPEEAAAAATGAGGTTSNGPTSGSGPSTNGAPASAGSGASCFSAGDASCQACVESSCGAVLDPACAAEALATAKFAACFFDPGCACENGYTNCFRLYEEDVAGSSTEAFALEGCVKANCRPVCDCCEI
jgi:hypothetical protein